MDADPIAEAGNNNLPTQERWKAWLVWAPVDLHSRTFSKDVMHRYTLAELTPESPPQ